MIYLASGSGETVDVRVQANVVATVDDAATIRFADSAVEAVDEGVDGEPVKDGGVLIVVDEFDDGQPTVDARVSRYRSVDDHRTWILELTASEEGADVTEAVEADDATHVRGDEPTADQDASALSSPSRSLLAASIATHASRSEMLRDGSMASRRSLSSRKRRSRSAPTNLPCTA